MSKYSRNSGYYDHSNNRWISGKYFSYNSTGSTFKEWLLFFGVVAGLLLILLSILEIGSWLWTGHSIIFPPKS
jgi:hypothetical protein